MASWSPRRFSTGISRRISSSAEMRADPGRVDSAPMSMMSAPCSSSSRARAKARSGSAYLPPSENESGVTLRMPMMSVRSPKLDLALLQLPVVAFSHGRYSAPVLAGLDHHGLAAVREGQLLDPLAVDLHGAGLDLSRGVADRFGQPDAGQQLVHADAGRDARLRGHARIGDVRGHLAAAHHAVELSAARSASAAEWKSVTIDCARSILACMGCSSPRRCAGAGAISGHAQVGEQLVVAPHQVVADRHQLARTSPRAAR